MAALHRSSVQDQIADVTECSICTEIFTNPKVLPCVHTFCLHCLEKYGNGKKPGDQMVCPICRKEFLIPVGGFSHLPNNFFIGKMVEIGKLTMTQKNKELCALCPEDDEVLAQLFCVDCEQNLCSRCGNGHKKSRFSQLHQIVELGSQLNSSEINLRNSYCDHHPGEQIKMFCYEDSAAICLICCVESHQSHRCVNVNKAAGEFVVQLKDRTGKVSKRLSECVEFEVTLDKFKKEFQAEVMKTEEGIRDAANKMTKLIEQHTELLIQDLKLVAERNLKAFEITKQDIDRFRVMIDSYSSYSERLLCQGSPVDICRATNQMLTRAQELETQGLSASSSGDCFCCDTMVFHPSHIELLMKSHGLNNAVGQLTVTRSKDWLLKFGKETTAILDATSSHQIHENPPVKMQPYTLTSENTDSEITTSITFVFDTRAMCFIQERPELMKYIDDSLDNLNCRVEWPSEGKEELNLEYTGKKMQSLIRGWDAECMNFLQRYADELTCMQLNVPREIWNDFKKKVKENEGKQSKQLDIAFENDQCGIQYIGLKKDTDEFEKVIKKIKGDLEEELERKKKIISEPLTNLKSHQLDLIRTEEFKKNLRQKIPDLEFEVKQTEVNLCGLPEVVKKAKLYILETVTEAVQVSFELSESKSKVFAKDEAKACLMKQLLSKGISASWMCNETRVNVFALDDKNLKEAVKVLEKEVIEKRLQLSELRLRDGLFQSHQWKDFIGCLCKEDKLLEVSVKDSVLMVTCMNSSFKKHKSRVEEFFAKDGRFVYPYNVFFRSVMAYQWQ